MNVAVFGLGYVGCVTAACLARHGHQVIGVDVNDDKVAMINAARPPIVEAGLGDLLKRVVSSGALHATTNVDDAVAATDLALVCVGTPGIVHGQPSFDAIRRVGRDIGRALQGRADRYLVVLRSTALPGTTEGMLRASLREGGGGLTAEIGVAVNPEFMREGASLHDFDHPPFVLIGAEDADDAERVAGLYAGVDARMVHTTLRTAEMVKYASNAFHGLKICFANEMADLAGALGADGRDVMRVFALDTKLNISDAYLKPGFAFGGSCLPKDVRALLWAGRAHEVETPVLSAMMPSNDRQIREALDTVLTFGRRRVGVVGLAFKPGTDDLRESPVVMLVEALIGKGLDVRILDRHVTLARLMGANRQYIETEIPHLSALLCDTPQRIVDHAEVVVIGTHGDDALAVLAALDPSQVVVDLTRTQANGYVPVPAAGGEGALWASRQSQR
jgi:GDP-mannose 6-dehydrogenase